MSHINVISSSTAQRSKPKALLDRHLRLPQMTTPRRRFQEPMGAQLKCLSIYFTDHRHYNYYADDDSLYDLLADREDELPEDTTALLLYLHKSEESREAIRELKLQGFPSRDSWESLVEVLDLLPNLERLDWELEMILPERILIALEKNNPECQVHYLFNPLHWDPYDDQLPDKDISQKEWQQLRSSNRVRQWEAIIGSKSLYALKTTISQGRRPTQEDVTLIFRMLAGCPNLRVLDLNIKESGGCIVSGGLPYAFDFMSYPGTKFPPLEVLKLEGYRLDELSDGGDAWSWRPELPWKERLRWPLSLLPELIIDQIGEYNFCFLSALEWRGPSTRPQPDVRTGMDCWLEAMDWSQLHTLELTLPPCKELTKLAGNVVSSLKTLVLKYPHKHAVIDILSNSTFVLKFLSLTGMGTQTPLTDVINAISTHQRSLESLVMYQPEDTWTMQGEEPLTANPAELSTLLTSCTQLKSLEIQVNRTSTWDDDIFQTLASSSSLTHLSIHYTSPDLNSSSETYVEPRGGWFMGSPHYGRTDTPDPLINQTSVMQLFQTIRQNKIGDEISKLDVFVGNWEDRFWPRSQGARPQKRVAWYSCDIMDDGKPVCQGEQIRNDD